MNYIHTVMLTSVQITTSYSSGYPARVTAYLLLRHQPNQPSGATKAPHPHGVERPAAAKSLNHYSLLLAGFNILTSFWCRNPGKVHDLPLLRRKRTMALNRITKALEIGTLAHTDASQHDLFFSYCDQAEKIKDELELAHTRMSILELLASSEEDDNESLADDDLRIRFDDMYFKPCFPLSAMLCMLLCNKVKTKPKVGSKKRKRKSEEISQPEEQKREDNQDPLEGTSKQYVTESLMSHETSGTSSSSTTNEDDVAMEEVEEQEVTDYRFIMLNHMPMKDATLKEICREWGILEVSYQWDIVDVEERKLIRVRYSYNTGSDVHKYLRSKAEIPHISDMYTIEDGETKGKWIGNNKRAVGESKVTKFLIERSI
ncbi:hypothetical protein ACJJTC_016630 [Scirpophaga incertulas]